MNNTTKIIGGIVLLALGVVGVLELSGLIDIDMNGWWAFFIIIPCFVSLFNDKRKTGSFIGLGIGILLFLAARDIIPWEDIWKYLLCVMAVVWGLALIFCRKSSCGCGKSDHHTVEELKQINQDGRQINKINVSFGKHLYEFSGQRFEGAEVQTSFGFTALDLRNADILDGAVINVECSFGGMEIRVGNDVWVKAAVESAFGSVENRCELKPTTGVKTLYIKGNCSFGGIEIK